ncbi:leucyl aminopeptidase family protein [Marivita geojedonensis]|uniref:Cytochrome c oxidase subunit II n=1 Tax=Marivita geojedonensis TaxID=1123756 RepID=A0A1X4NLB1_9RHOB|nr:leucyl aminopeptidase family protein [Marivita geojedonensis]OSQ51050.1 cytochrome c oxidase subunit II [Marivita geojedonensis]PRY79942.1 leucyl aminopeptidase [Marivita geojedonensis]
MTVALAPAGTDAVPLHVLGTEDVALWAGQQSDRIRTWVEASGFKGGIGAVLMIPDANGHPEAALVGYGTPATRRRDRFALAAALPKLAKGTYRIEGGIDEDHLEQEALGWLLACYNFDRYRENSVERPSLVVPDRVDAARVSVLAEAEFLTRDLINTPASDMGPEELETAARALADKHKAKITVITGEALLKNNFPMIHAVGRASDRAPRLIDMSWGKRGPKVTLVGKGVCFDTGGLNIKPGSSMGLMKKDMGGAANVLGLAHMIMASGLEVRLRVLIPAVENSVSGNSFRPQDILTSRKGLTVEINNTDAEGRLVLADALTLGAEDTPDLIVSMATLTGAARVAVGPDLAPYYTDDDVVATSLDLSARRMADPVWRMPFHDPYETMIEPGIADLDNAPKGGFAGSITAALFLRRFVTEDDRYIHFDIYGWQPTAAPGRPKGGALQGARALFDSLPVLLDL